MSGSSEVSGRDRNLDVAFASVVDMVLTSQLRTEDQLLFLLQAGFLDFF